MHAIIKNILSYSKKGAKITKKQNLNYTLDLSLMESFFNYVSNKNIPFLSNF